MNSPALATATEPESKFALSSWCNTSDVLARMEALLNQPVRSIRPENMTKVLEYFDQKCKRSKQIVDAAEKVIPGGVQHNLAFNYPHALAIAQADGAQLTDVDGNEYIDFLQAGGPTLLGSNYQPVREKIHELLEECGPVTGLLHEYEVKLAEKVCEHFPAVDLFRMLGSGTEAAMAAIRVARAYRSQMDHQNGWWLPRLVRPTDLRYPNSRNRSDGRSGHSPFSDRKDSREFSA